MPCKIEFRKELKRRFLRTARRQHIYRALSRKTIGERLRLRNRTPQGTSGEVGPAKSGARDRAARLWHEVRPERKDHLRPDRRYTLAPEVPGRDSHHPATKYPVRGSAPTRPGHQCGRRQLQVLGRGCCPRLAACPTDKPSASRRCRSTLGTEKQALRSRR